MIKTHPILFSGDMVRAILEGRKSQTRRTVKPQPYPVNDTHWNKSGCVGGQIMLNEDFLASCPYGQPGSLIWIRETFWHYGKWVKNGLTKTGKQAWKFKAANVCPFGEWVRFEGQPKIPRTEEGFHKRPSIFIPRWASRITLEIKDIRVERLQDISEEDAKAEGVFTDEMRPEEHDYKNNWKLCPKCAGTGLHNGVGENLGVIFDIDCTECDTAKKRFKNLWKSINGPESWDANPWVWPIEFEHHLCNIDEYMKRAA